MDIFNKFRATRPGVASKQSRARKGMGTFRNGLPPARHAPPFAELPLRGAALPAVELLGLLGSPRARRAPVQPRGVGLQAVQRALHHRRPPVANPNAKEGAA